MKLILAIFLLSLTPLWGQDKSVNEQITSLDTLILSGKNIPTYSDSLRRAVPKSQSLGSGYLYKVVFITFLLLIVLIAGLFFYKKFILKSDKVFSSTIKVIARQNLSAKQSIVIVKIEEKKYALGVTEQQVNLITDLGIAAENDKIISESKPVGFGSILKKMTTKE